MGSVYFFFPALHVQSVLQGGRAIPVSTAFLFSEAQKIASLQQPRPTVTLEDGVRAAQKTLAKMLGGEQQTKNNP